MATLTTLQKTQKQFDFKTNNIEVMDIDTLQRTHKENNVYGNPLKGIYHYQAILNVAALCQKHNLNYEIEEIFAAQNKNKTEPGVIVLPEVEKTFGERAVEAHVLRRIFPSMIPQNGALAELLLNESPLN